MALQKAAIPFSNTKLRVPQGFQNLMEGLAREVLRDQPTDIYSYGAKYFITLLNKRDTKGDPAEIGAGLMDRYYNDTSFQDPDIDPTDLNQQDAALKIQTKFRQHHAKHIVKTKREEKAATSIQAGYRGYLDRKRISEIKKSQQAERRALDEMIAAEPVPDFVDPDDPEVNKAATAIQAGFKGYKARQEVKEMKNKKQEDTLNKRITETLQQVHKQGIIDIDMNDPQVAAAATKIQAGYKGYKVRKDVKGQAGPESGAAAKKEEASDFVQEEEIDIDLNDPEVEKAAVKIQASFRGFQTRQQHLSSTQQQGKGKEEQKAAKGANGAEQEIDIDLNDPEVAAAAAKIQAGFKGMKLRKGLHREVKTKEELEDESQIADEEVEVEVATVSHVSEPARDSLLDIDLNDPEMVAAATKIQASFKGYRVRKEQGEKPHVEEPHDEPEEHEEEGDEESDDEPKGRQDTPKHD